MKITANMGAPHRVIYVVGGLAVAALPLWRPMPGLEAAGVVVLGLVTAVAGAIGF